jgi:23S rRNA (guanosine2251-2'-O)-methyltransferase
MVFGVEPVREIIAAGPSRIVALHVKPEAVDRFRSEIEAVRSIGGRIIDASNHELARMAGSEARHQGIIATVRPYDYSRFEDIVGLAPDPMLIVDGVTDPRNLGAIMRVAECAGLGAVVLAKDRTVGVTPAAIKSSAGAWAHLKIARCGNVAQTLEDLQGKGYWIAALDPRGETALDDLDVSRRLTLVLGSEGRGIRDLVRKKADFVVRIPMYGRVSSLNVSVAAGIALFDIARRRAKRPDDAAASSALQKGRF